jgi:hypothetical protein
VGFVDDLTKDYLRGLGILSDRMRNVFMESLDRAGISSVESRYDIFQKTISSLKSFSGASLKIQSLQDSLSQTENVVQNFTLDASKTRHIFEPIKREAEEIINYFRNALISVNDEIREVFKQIEESPLGKKEYGTIFEDLVLSFFDITFIHELVRENPQDLKHKATRFDGFYNKLETFDAKRRTGFEFENLLIECKNKKPKVNDLMQCFKYTLFFQASKLSSIPLTLLVCRHLPGKNSSIWEINRKIFDKQIDNETRLIILLDIDDLGEMKEIKVNEGDPAKIIKDKISKFC